MYWHLLIYVVIAQGCCEIIFFLERLNIASKCRRERFSKHVGTCIWNALPTVIYVYQPTKFTESELRIFSINMCCINIHFTIILFIFSKYIICKLLYMIVTHDQSKTLYNKVIFFRYKFYRFANVFAHTQNPSKVWLFKLGWLLLLYINQCSILFCVFIIYFVIFKYVKYRFKLFNNVTNMLFIVDVRSF